MIVSFFFDSAMISATALGAEVQVATASNLTGPMRISHRHSSKRGASPSPKFTKAA